MEKATPVQTYQTKSKIKNALTLYKKQLSMLFSIRGRGNTHALTKTGSTIIIPTENQRNEIKDAKLFNMNNNPDDLHGRDENETFCYDNHAIQVLLQVGVGSLTLAEQNITSLEDQLYVANFELKRQREENEKLSNSIDLANKRILAIELGFFGRLFVGKKLSGIKLALKS